MVKSWFGLLRNAMYKDVGRGALYNLCLFKVSFNALPAKIVIEDLYINQFSDKIMPSASHL